MENDSNDMFVATENGIALDKSGDCSVKFGFVRNFAEEISMHHNKILAEQAIEGMLGGKDNLFWRFRNSEKSNKDIGLKKMDLNTVLSLSPDEMKDYEFLAVSYIDRYKDITGIDDVTSTGHKQNTRKLMVVQGFNLSDQIQVEFKDSYARIEKDREVQLSVLAENRRAIVIELVVLMGSIFISFFAISALYNAYIKVGCEDGECK